MARGRFQATLEEVIRKVIEDNCAAVCGGQPQDYPSYREQVGYIRGLTDALKLCEDTERDLD